MNLPPPEPRRSGMTLVEVMLIMVVVGMVAVFVLLPRITRPRTTNCRIGCVNNLKQIGLGYRQWAMDHGDHFPMSWPMVRGGTQDHPLRFRAWVHFQVLSNELNTPRILVCPVDPNRVEAGTFRQPFSNHNVSYLVGLGADEGQPQVMLSGDRNLTTNGVPLPAGLHEVGPSGNLGWTRALHNQCGNIGLSDGSVQQLTSIRLSEQWVAHPQTNRLAIP